MHMPVRRKHQHASLDSTAMVPVSAASLSGWRRKFLGGEPGSWAWFVIEPGEVDGASGVEGFLRGADRESGAQDGVLVAVVGGGVDREAEGVSRAAAAQPAQRDGAALAAHPRDCTDG